MERGVRRSNISFDGIPDVLDGVDVRWPHWTGEQVGVFGVFIHPFGYNSGVMTRCIVLLMEDVPSGMLLRKKWEHIVIKHIPVTLARDGRCHTCHGSQFSIRKQSSDENTTSTSLKRTLQGRRIHRIMGFAPYSYPAIGVYQCESRIISQGNIFPNFWRP